MTGRDSRSAGSSVVDPPYVAFDAAVSRVVRLTPSFVRVTLSGPQLHHFADHGFDQRLKLIFPIGSRRESQFRHFPRAPDWYGQWRALPVAQRNPMRTYTVRTVRADLGEVDVDLVLHGDSGPASRWASSAVVGDELILIGPNGRSTEPTGAVEWRPPSSARRLLIGADATAVPAACNILDALPQNACGVAILEVPTLADMMPVRAPEAVDVRWLARRRGYGAALEAGIREAVVQLLDDRRGAAPGDDEEPADDEMLWDVPTSVSRSPFYAWLAGEAGAVTAVRRHLVSELGVDRKAVAFMGYWRLGRAQH